MRLAGYLPAGSGVEEVTHSLDKLHTEKCGKKAIRSLNKLLKENCTEVIGSLNKLLTENCAEEVIHSLTELLTENCSKQLIRSLNKLLTENCGEEPFYQKWP